MDGLVEKFYNEQGTEIVCLSKAIIAIYFVKKQDKPLYIPQYLFDNLPLFIKVVFAPNVIFNNKAVTENGFIEVSCRLEPELRYSIKFDDKADFELISDQELEGIINGSKSFQSIMSARLLMPCLN